MLSPSPKEKGFFLQDMEYPDRLWLKGKVADIIANIAGVYLKASVRVEVSKHYLLSSSIA
jgi:hypothetical protein